MLQVEFVSVSTDTAEIILELPSYKEKTPDTLQVGNIHRCTLKLQAYPVGWPTFLNRQGAKRNRY